MDTVQAQQGHGGMRVLGIASTRASRRPDRAARDPCGRRQVPIWIDQARPKNILAGLGGDATPAAQPRSEATLLAGGGLRLRAGDSPMPSKDSTFPRRSQLTSPAWVSPLDRLPPQRMHRPGPAHLLQAFWMLEEVVPMPRIPSMARLMRRIRRIFRRFLDQLRPPN